MAQGKVQTHGGFSVGSVTSFTTTAITLTAGNALLAGWVTNTTAATGGTISASVAQTWTQNLVSLAGANTTVGIASAKNIAGGSSTFTLTPGVSAYCSISLIETNPTDATEATASATGTSTTPSPGAVNPASGGDLYWAVGADEAASGTTTGNTSGEGWALGFVSDDRANQPIYGQWLVASGSQTGSFTITTSALWIAVVATVNAAATTTTVPRCLSGRPFPFKPGSPKYR